MSKIPVFSTVSRTYGFLLGEIGTIVRLAWAPLLIAAGLNFYFGGQAIDLVVASKDSAAAMGMASTNFLIGIVSFLANIMVIVALLRVVLFGDRKVGMIVYLWFGTAEMRLVIVYILLLVAAIAGVIGLGIGFGLLAAIAAAVPGLNIVVELAAIALVLTAIWAVLKLTLIPAVVVAENNLGVERAWALMRGNALRMFFVLFFTYLPIGVIGIILTFAVLGSDVPPFPDFQGISSGKLKPDEVRAMAEVWQTGLLKAMRIHWVEFSLLNYIGAIISAALVAGTAGNSYTALAGERS